MKNLKNHADVIHHFCNMVGENGKSSNVFFTNNTLYSYGYHFELAKIVKSKNNELVLLVNTASYSTSTSKHQSILRRSINKSLFADVLYFDFNRSFGFGRSEYCLNANSVTDQIKSILNSAKNAFYDQTKAKIDSSHHNEGLKKIAVCNSLSNHFGNDSDYEMIQSFLVENEGLIQSSLRNQNACLGRQNEKEVLRLEKQKSAEVENLKKLELWANNNSVKLGNFYNLPVKLRIKDSTIETSKGANIPLRGGVILLDRLRSGKDCKGFKVGNYTMIEATLDYVKIGCHTIGFDEINRFANLNGL